MSTLRCIWCHQKKELKLFFYPPMPVCTSIHLFTPAPSKHPLPDLKPLLTLPKSTSILPQLRPRTWRKHCRKEKKNSIPSKVSRPTAPSRAWSIPHGWRRLFSPPLPAALMTILLCMSTRTLLLIVVVLRV